MTLENSEKYLNTTIKQDPDIIKKLTRVYLSTYTDNPINVFVLAPSSEGKSYATVESSKIFPKEDVIIIGSMSPTALIHDVGVLVDKDGFPIQDSIDSLDQRIFEAKNGEKIEFERQKKDLLNEAFNLVDLKNKILIFIDNPKKETYEMLKPIMSHDNKELIYKTTKGDGSLFVKKTVIKNWAVFIFCSAKNEAKNEVWVEMKNRALIISPNTEVKKYEEANKLTGQKFGLPSCLKSIYHNDNDEKNAIEEIENLKGSLNELCKNGNPVLNVFYNKISELFPHKDGESMRHFTRFMSFLNIETLINADNRPSLILENDGIREKIILTTTKDIENAVKTMGDISTLAPDKIKFMENVFKPLLEETLDGKEKGLTTTQLAEKYTKVNEKPITTKKILENYTEHLVNAGVLDYTQEFDRGEKYFFLANSVTLDSLENLKSNLIEPSNSHESFVDLCLKQIEISSIQNGYSDRQYEYDNRVITLEELKLLLFQ